MDHPDCSGCPYRDQGRGPVPSEVRPSALLVVVGEAPGRHEVEDGRPFVGWSGDQLERGLGYGGLSRSSASILNVLSCMPPRGEEPDPAAVEACGERLRGELREVSPRGGSRKVFLALGKLALGELSRFLSIELTTGSIEAQHGAVEECARGFLVASLHPAYASRGRRSHLPWISGPHGAIARAARAAGALARGAGGFVEVFGFDPSPDEAHVFPSIETVERVCRRLVEERPCVTVDVETDSADQYDARLRLVGLRARLLGGTEVAMPVPLRRVDGSWWWESIDERRRAEEAVRGVLSACPLNMHNASFDVTVLKRAGLWPDALRRKVVFDTMIADLHCGGNDLKHGLGFCVLRRFPVRLWKKDVSHKAAEGVRTDEDLHRYNVSDVVMQGRLYESQLSELTAHGAWEPFAIDCALQPIFRDAGELGLFVDEARRAELLGHYERECERLLALVRERVGKTCPGGVSFGEFNPRSQPQMARWLFDLLDIPPTLDVDEHPWVGGASPSTGIPALVLMVDRGGLPREVVAAIEAIIEYKSADKVRGTYLANLPTKSQEGLPEGLSHLPFTYQQHVTPSGRTSTSWNCQNIPARAWGGVDLHSIFVPPPGHVLVISDFEQIELRIYAKEADDRLLLKAFAEGLDPHTLAWATLVCPSESEAQVMELYDRFMAMKRSDDPRQRSLVNHYRRIAKAFEFGVIYGIEEQGLFDSMASERDKATGKRTFPGLKRSDVARWFRRWHRMHPETRRQSAKVDRFVATHSYVEEGFHHRRRWFKGGIDKRNAPRNMVIQGRAAAYKNEAILRLDSEIPHGKWSRFTGFVLDVHDEIGLYVPEERAEEAAGILRRCMSFDFDGLPIVCDTPTVLKRWAKG